MRGTGYTANFDLSTSDTCFSFFSCSHSINSNIFCRLFRLNITHYTPQRRKRQQEIRVQINLWRELREREGEEDTERVEREAIETARRRASSVDPGELCVGECGEVITYGHIIRLHHIACTDWRCNSDDCSDLCYHKSMKYS